MKRSCPEAEERDGGLRRAVTEIERLLGYVFRDQSLLAEALTHSSYPDHRSYQRLEFVGDAALSLAITNHLYLTNPDLGPGRLSALRAANISTEKLARVAVRHRLYRFLRRNSHALDQMVFDFTNLVMMEREEEIGWAPYGGSTVKAPKVLADIVESIAAAVYVDCNFDLELLWKVSSTRPLLFAASWVYNGGWGLGIQGDSGADHHVGEHGRAAGDNALRALSEAGQKHRDQELEERFCEHHQRLC
ncbi:hypothetical protein B296_00044755 [Ensete ventricosum]|uniref:RNase III domain-containing protein n=1 Tax=Ensete ventricosum TaxID=4639 RepID=A0A426Y445_ENSVE|nr:hypothetical protein B296_00044755 [Ensete ventricosum]